MLYKFRFFSNPLRVDRWEAEALDGGTRDYRCYTGEQEDRQISDRGNSAYWVLGRLRSDGASAASRSDISIVRVPEAAHHFRSSFADLKESTVCSGQRVGRDRLRRATQ